MQFFLSEYKMNKALRPSVKRSIVMGIIIFLLAFSVPVLAAPPEQRKSKADNEGRQVLLSKISVTIEKKSLERIYTLSGSFAISGETLIVGTDGKEVNIKKMLVPCDAEVQYSVENGGRMVHRIDIKRVADGASWQWTSEKPE
jgi:hypothetical protein